MSIECFMFICMQADCSIQMMCLEQYEGSGVRNFVSWQPLNALMTWPSRFICTVTRKKVYVNVNVKCIEMGSTVHLLCALNKMLPYKLTQTHIWCIEPKAPGVNGQNTLCTVSQCKIVEIELWKGRTWKKCNNENVRGCFRCIVLIQLKGKMLCCAQYLYLFTTITDLIWLGY